MTTNTPENFEQLARDICVTEESDFGTVAFTFTPKQLAIYTTRLKEELAKQPKLPSPELTWLFTHCRAIGMTEKSDSGKWEEDIALFTIRQKERIEELAKQQKDCHAELLAIHDIIMCIAECPPVKDTDTFTVRGVKEMAYRINQQQQVEPVAWRVSRSDTLTTYWDHPFDDREGEDEPWLNEPLYLHPAPDAHTDASGDYWVDSPNDPFCKHRCKYCGAGDDANHSFTCPTKKHPEMNLTPERMEQLSGLAKQLKDVIEDPDGGFEEALIKGMKLDEEPTDFDEWAEAYALDDKPIYSQIIREDCEAAHKAGQQGLLNMLCIVHRDGGQYISEHGLHKAYEDAMEKLHRWKLRG